MFIYHQQVSPELVNLKNFYLVSSSLLFPFRHLPTLSESIQKVAKQHSRSCLIVLSL